MIRSVLYLEPKDGDYDAVVEFFRREDVLGRALSQRGCLGGELHVPTNGSGPILVTALWESEDAYQGWVTSPVRMVTGREGRRGVEQLFVPVSQLRGSTSNPRVGGLNSPSA